MREPGRTKRSLARLRERRGRLHWAVLVFLVVVVTGVLVGGLLYRRARERHLRAELAAAETERKSGLLETAYDRLVALDAAQPGNDEVLDQLGLCAEARGNLDKAIEAWSRIAETSPLFGKGAVVQATAGINVGRYSASESALLNALPKIQNREIAHQARRALSRLYRFEGRVADVRRVLRETWPTTPDPAGLLKELWFLDNSPQPAEAWLKSLEKADPSDPRVWLGRASLATLTADWAEANRQLEACEKALPADPAVARARLDLAMATNDAAGVRRAAALIPSDQLSPSEILELRAWLQRANGDTPAERTTLQSLIAADPGKFSALERLSELDHETGDAKAFETLHQKRIELDQAKDRFRKLLLAEGRLSEVRNELAAISKTLGRDFDAWAWSHFDSQTPDPVTPRPDTANASTMLSALIGDIPVSQAIAAAATSDARVAVPTFVDEAERAGLDFVFDNGQTALHQLPETMSGGVGVLDYNGDGFLDIYVPQGGRIEADSQGIPNADRLYKNLGNGAFQDVSKEAGLPGFARDYGLGVTIGDYDNDGDPDIFVTRLTSYALYQNHGDGTFKDVTNESGLAGPRDNPTSAAFADLDNDGDLDLYVAHYMIWNPNDPRLCENKPGEYFYCDPSRVDPAPDHVFRNDGGKFVDVTAEAGFTDRDGRGLGVVAADLDGDHKVEVYVANDGTANFLFQNLGGFKFEETGLIAGVAAGPEGGFQASMGVACGDQDGDGLLDLIVTNFYGESSTLYQNLGKGLFRDRTADSGLGSATRYLLGFGTFFGDFNNDGKLDLATVNGHVNDNRPYYPYQMPAKLLLGGPGGKFQDPGAEAGEAWKVARLGRGLAVADLDNDGKLDALFASQNEPLAYLHNTSEAAKIGHFITFQLESTTSNRDAVGASVSITAGGRKQVAQRLGGGSYQSACDPRIHFGLGTADKVDAAEVTWPSGKVDTWSGLQADKGYRLREGSAEVSALAGFGGK